MMFARRRLNMLLLVLCLILASAAGLLLVGQPAPITAQGGPPVTVTPSPVPTITLTRAPDPTATAAASVFTLEQAELISHYPAGVEYVVRASSSAGAIVRAQVAYRTREGTLSSQSLAWDADRGAFVYFDRRFSPPWWQTFYRFRLTDAAGNRLETEEFVSEYADRTRQWTRRENEQIIVLLYGVRDSLADELFASAAASIAQLEEQFGFALDYKPYVVIMPNLRDFQEWQEYPDPYRVGVTYFDRGYTIQVIDTGRVDEDELVEATVPHELTHVFQRFIAEARDIPAWFTEGQATYNERMQDYDYAGRVRALADQLPTLQSTISLEFPGPDGRIRWAYDVGYTFYKFWVETYGWDVHRAFWQAQVTMGFYEAMTFATGVPFPELENAWRVWMGAPGPAPTLIPTPTMPPLPTAPGMSG